MRYGLFALAIVLLLSGGVIFVIGNNDFVIRSIGIVMFVGGANLVRVSRVGRLKGLPSTTTESLDPEASRRPGRLAWAVGVASAVATGISFIFLYKDALDGYHQIWPVYMFAASSLICALAWSYLVAKLT
jgi:hypothetical protein